MANYDVIIVGAGPAGIFTALEMLRKGSKKKVLIVEKGVSVEKRACPKAKTKVCMNCKPYCHITTGFSRSSSARSWLRPRSTTPTRSTLNSAQTHT